MTESEKVISDVISAFDEWENNMCCPGEDWSDVHQSRDMVIALLKAQEPKPPIVKENSYGWKFYYCPSCGKEFYQNNKFSFCEKCGQAVKWE
jgi:exosome complex RNA-binding protein Csl4